MTRSFTLSLLFHAVILALALLVLPKAPPFKVKEPTPIVVDISTIADKNQQAATTVDKTPDTPDPAPKESKPAPDTPPQQKIADKANTAAHEQTAPPPDPKPVPPAPKPVDDSALKQMLADQQAELQKRLDDEKKLEEQKKAEAKKLADEKKKKLDQTLAEAQLLLNKKLGEAATTAPSTDKKGTPKQADKNAKGSDAAATATIVSALVSKVKGCFDIPPAAREANVSVPIHFMLNKDGSVLGQPEVAQDSSDPVVQATARAAIAAIMQCQNYDLPADQYDLWKDNVLDFNPTQLSG